MRHLREPQARLERAGQSNYANRTLRGVLGLTSAALLYIAATQIPYSQNSEITPAMPPTETPTPTPTPTMSSPPPLGEVLAHNLRAGHPFREFALVAFHFQGYETTLQQCKTDNHDYALGTVVVDNLSIRSLPNESTPSIVSFTKGSKIVWRVQALLKHWSSNVSERWLGIEDGLDLNFAAATYRSADYVKNDPTTVCTPIKIADLTLK